MLLTNSIFQQPLDHLSMITWDLCGTQLLVSGKLLLRILDFNMKKHRFFFDTKYGTYSEELHFQDYVTDNDIEIQSKHRLKLWIDKIESSSNAVFNADGTFSHFRPDIPTIQPQDENT